MTKYTIIFKKQLLFIKKVYNNTKSLLKEISDEKI